MSGIAAVSSRDIWAVGTDGGPGSTGHDLPVVEHWDGRTWHLARTPSLRGSAELTGVTALSPTDVWAVGQVRTQPLAEHWDGRRWRAIVMHREGALSAVDGASPHDVWAVGAQGLTGLSINDEFGLVMHWNGRHWQEVSRPLQDDSALGYEQVNDYSGIDAVARRDAWATHNGVVRGDVQRWDGHWWNVAHVFPSVGQLRDIAAVSSANVWAVGYRSVASFEPGSLRPLIAHDDGHSWLVQATNFDRLHASLNGISVLTPREIWAAGDHLIARYSC